MAVEPTSEEQRKSTGIAGLDDILGGGLPANHLYALYGAPGAGKTTLGLQFLLEGRRRGEAGLLITLSESSSDLRAIARSHGWSTEGLPIYQLPAADRARVSPQTMFPPAEIELEETTASVLAEIDRVGPARLVIDSMSQIRLLARDPFRYRREIVVLKRYFEERGCTALLIDELPARAGEELMQTVAHGVILLEKVSVAYGLPRGRLIVSKLRGSAFREGFHDYRIRTGGLAVYPRVAPGTDAGVEADAVRGAPLSTHLPELDALFGGGLDAGTSTLLIGPAGAGKTTLATLFAAAAAGRGEDVAVYLFTERIETLVDRSEMLGMDLRPHLRSGRVSVEEVDPVEVSPGELSDRVRHMVRERKPRLVILDSLNGLVESVPDEQLLSLQIHELLGFLSHNGVATILVLAQQGLVGTLTQIPIDVSYLADTVILLRFFEARGQVRAAVSMLKKRSGGHEHLIREFRITGAGVQVGPPLEEFQGVLTGIPEYLGPPAPLLRGEQGEDGGED